MPTRYGHSPWIDRFPKSRVPSYPKHHGALKVDAVIVGGGLTGCATAYAFAAAGVKVALFEGERVGRGASGGATGWIGDDPSVSFLEIEKLAGRRPARPAWQAWRRGALDFTALIRRLGIKCDLETRGSLLIATTPEQMLGLKRDHQGRRAAGLDGALVNARAVADALALASAGALRGREGATVDPYRLTLGLAAAAVERGAQLFEQSPVQRIKFDRKDAEISTAGGAFRTRRIVIATAMPTPALFGSLARHFWFKTRYLVLTEPVPARIRSQLGARSTVLRDLAAPPHVIRWVDDDRLLVAGADSETPPAKLREKTIVQRTGQLMYELSTMYPEVSGIMPAYGWDAPYTLTAEGLPYFGAHRNFPHQLLAFGDSSHGITGAFVASRVLLRQFLDEAEAGDAAFSFTR